MKVEPDLESQVAHRHDWRYSPHRVFRNGRGGQKEYMLRCPMCELIAWGREQADIIEWPRWTGVVVEIDGE